MVSIYRKGLDPWGVNCVCRSHGRRPIEYKQGSRIGGRSIPTCVRGGFVGNWHARKIC